MNITLTEADFARLVRAVVDAAPDRRCARCGHGEWFHPWTQDLDADYRAVNSPYQQCAACVHEDRDDCNHDFEPVGAPPVPPQDDALDFGRAFVLKRDEDVSGISGTGVVAQGIEFDDGMVVLRWCVGEYRSTVVWPSIEAVEAIHGHDGRTSVVWAAARAPHSLDGGGERPTDDERWAEIRSLRAAIRVARDDREAHRELVFDFLHNHLYGAIECECVILPDKNLLCSPHQMIDDFLNGRWIHPTTEDHDG